MNGPNVSWRIVLYILSEESYVSESLSACIHALAVVYLPAWLVGWLCRKHDVEAPKLESRLLPFAMISILSGFLIMIFYGQAWFLEEKAFHVSFLSPNIFAMTLGALLLLVLVFWAGITLWMWKAWVTRWELGFKVLWPGAAVMMLGRISVGFLSMLFCRFG